MRVWLRALWALITAIWVTAHTAVGAGLRPEEQRLAYRLRRQVIGCRAVCRAVNMHTTLADNAEPLRSGALVVCNHFSAMDPLVLGSLLPVCFVGKVAIDGWPILGWVCRTHGMLLVDRSRRRTALQLTEQIRDRLRAGFSVLVFAEGTTSDGGRLLSFKSGTFKCVTGCEDGYVQPAFLHVVAVNGLFCVGSEGREALSHNRHPTLVRHLLHLYGHKRIDFVVRIGPAMAAFSSDRKSLARVTHEQVARLAINSTLYP